MKTVFRCLICLLGVLVLHALPGFAEQTPDIEVLPACRSSVYIFDKRENPPEITGFLLNGEKTDNVFQLPFPLNGFAVYEVALPWNDKTDFHVALKTQDAVILEKSISLPTDLGPCFWPRPSIIDVSPARVLEGGKLTITGTNLGTDNTDLTLYLRNNTPIISESITPPDNNKIQTATFLVPTKKMLPDLYKDSKMWDTDVPITVMTSINNKKTELSNWVRSGLVRSDAKGWLVASCLAITAAIFFIAYCIMRNCFETSCAIKQTCLMLFFDRQTNTYSLSKLQAMIWTVVILWSYLYLTLGKFFLTGDFVIPDLEKSVLELLGISYTGLLTARGVGKSFPKNDLAATQPKFCDLFSENNEISLPRLQLFAFTIVGFIIYIASSFNPEFFEIGLPKIPDTLNALFLISQGGYIGGKLTGSSAVNHILPRRITAPFPTPVTIYGRSFADKTMVLVQGLQDSIATLFLNQNAVQFSLSNKPLDIGLKQLVIIPPTGSSYALENAVEVIAPKIRKTLLTDPSGHPALEVDFIGIVLNGEPLTAHSLPPAPTPPGGTPPTTAPQGDTQLSITHAAGNRYRVTRPGGLITGGTIRIAALDGSFAFETTAGGTATEGYEPVTLI